MSALFMIVAAILLLGPLIAIHEFGHYFVARKLGVKVLVYSIGFGPTVLKWTSKKSGIQYQLSALPLGGYVKMLDEREAPVPADQKHLAFNTQPLRKRVAIVAAGPVANLVLAIFLYSVVNWMGVQEAKAILASPVAGSIAQRAGLLGGEYVKQAGFVGEDLGLYRVPFTTQIEPYDFMAAQFDNWKRINNILMDFSRDVWAYVSMEYFKQKIKEGEVGSSAMPHKVNPIDFENAEGNLGIANALFEHLSAKLPISRLQRDLTDSTVLRNLGVPFAHTLIALNSLERGLNKLLLNEDAVSADLGNNWAVVAEAIQTILRREGYEKPYEALKDLTRKNDKITERAIKEFIETLDISEKTKYELKQITPFTFTGI